MEKELSKKQQIHILYIGGGHGWPKHKWNGMLSALKTQHVEEIHNCLTQREVVIQSIILGSCFSASFANDFSNLLHPQCGVMLSSTVSQGETNFFENVVSIVLRDEDPCSFFKIMNRGLKAHPVLSPTGICISEKERHFGLELNQDETGLPTHSVGDEYALSLDIVIGLRKAKPKSIFGISLEECHDEQQKENSTHCSARRMASKKGEDMEHLPDKKENYLHLCRKNPGAI